MADSDDNLTKLKKFWATTTGKVVLIGGPILFIILFVLLITASGRKNGVNWQQVNANRMKYN